MSRRRLTRADELKVPARLRGVHILGLSRFRLNIHYPDTCSVPRWRERQALLVRLRTVPVNSDRHLVRIPYFVEPWAVSAQVHDALGRACRQNDRAPLSVVPRDNTTKFPWHAQYLLDSAHPKASKWGNSNRSGRWIRSPALISLASICPIENIHYSTRRAADILQHTRLRRKSRGCPVGLHSRGNRMSHRTLRRAILGVGLALSPIIVHAQTAPEGETTPDTAPALQEITVTAQRRSESLEQAALAITAISAEALTNSGTTRVQELTTLIPSLQVGSAAGPYPLFY